MKKRWTCDVCKKPIPNGRGYISVMDPDTGGYPMREKEFRARDRANPAYAEEIARLDAARAARKLEPFQCDPNPEMTSYWFGVERAQSLDAWTRWALHLGEKGFMTRGSLKRFLAFWFVNRGESQHLD